MSTIRRRIGLSLVDRLTLCLKTANLDPSPLRRIQVHLWLHFPSSFVSHSPLLWSNNPIVHIAALVSDPVAVEKRGFWPKILDNVGITAPIHSFLFSCSNEHWLKILAYLLMAGISEHKLSVQNSGIPETISRRYTSKIFKSKSRTSHCDLLKPRNRSQMENSCESIQMTYKELLRFSDSVFGLQFVICIKG